MSAASRPEGGRPLTMSLEQYGVAIQAAFEEGYIQGAHHPHGTSILKARARIAAAFWQRVSEGIATRFAAEVSP